MIGILALILQIVMIVIIFSLPGRFREQREHMERQKREITDKLYAMQKTQDELLRLVEALQKNDAAAPRDPQNDRTTRQQKTCAPLRTHVFLWRWRKSISACRQLFFDCGSAAVSVRIFAERPC